MLSASGRRPSRRGAGPLGAVDLSILLGPFWLSVSVIRHYHSSSIVTASFILITLAHNHLTISCHACMHPLTLDMSEELRAFEQALAMPNNEPVAEGGE